jgi:glycosyltransferase involved in cell wall biosynthesis
VQESILAGASSIRHIPYGVDLDIFRPQDRGAARRIFNLPVDAHVIFFSAVGGMDGTSMNARKGFSELIQALERLPDAPSILLLTSGSVADVEQYASRFNIIQLGYLSDERQQRLAIASADLVAFPSLADNLPLVLIEALACGVPSVAFDVGGVSELVSHMETGYLARYKDVTDFAHGIQLLLQDEDLRNRMSEPCRKAAESEYSIELQVKRYLETYEEGIERAQSLPKNQRTPTTS